MKEQSLKDKISTLKKELKTGQENVKNITKVLEKISPKMKKKFMIIFKDFPDIDLKDSKRALEMCVHAEQSVKVQNEEAKELLGEYFNEFIKHHNPEVKFLCDYKKEIESFLAEKQKEEQEKIQAEKEKQALEELSQHPKVEKNFQANFQKFNSIKEAQSYYEDCAYEYFDCGQGYYEDNIAEYCFVQDVFFKVDIEAQIESSKQDRGDRLYFVDYIKKVDCTPYDFKQYQADKKAEKEKLIAQKEKELEVLKQS